MILKQIYNIVYPTAVLFKATTICVNASNGKHEFANIVGSLRITM